MDDYEIIDFLDELETGIGKIIVMFVKMLILPSIIFMVGVIEGRVLILVFKNSIPYAMNILFDTDRFTMTNFPVCLGVVNLLTKYIKPYIKNITEEHLGLRRKDDYEAD